MATLFLFVHHRACITVPVQTTTRCVWTIAKTRHYYVREKTVTASQIITNLHHHPKKITLNEDASSPAGSHDVNRNLGGNGKRARNPVQRQTLHRVCRTTNPTQKKFLVYPDFHLTRGDHFSQRCRCESECHWPGVCGPMEPVDAPLLRACTW